MEEMEGLGQRYLKGSMRDCFLFDSWLFLKKAAEAAASIGVDLIGMMKTNSKGFCKAMIEWLTKDWPGGSYIAFRRKPMFTGERKILAIGYKYKSWNLLSFVDTEGVGSTTLGIPYLSKYTYQFSNILIGPFARPLLKSKIFGSVNDVES